MRHAAWLAVLMTPFAPAVGDADETPQPRPRAEAVASDLLELRQAPPVAGSTLAAGAEAFRDAVGRVEQRQGDAVYWQADENARGFADRPAFDRAVPARTVDAWGPPPAAVAQSQQAPPAAWPSQEPDRRATQTVWAGGPPVPGPPPGAPRGGFGPPPRGRMGPGSSFAGPPPGPSGDKPLLATAFELEQVAHRLELQGFVRESDAVRRAAMALRQSSREQADEAGERRGPRPRAGGRRRDARRRGYGMPRDAMSGMGGRAAIRSSALVEDRVDVEDRVEKGTAKASDGCCEGNACAARNKKTDGCCGGETCGGRKGDAKKGANGPDKKAARCCEGGACDAAGKGKRKDPAKAEGKSPKGGFGQGGGGFGGGWGAYASDTAKPAGLRPSGLPERGVHGGPTEPPAADAATPEAE